MESIFNIITKIGTYSFYNKLSLIVLLICNLCFFFDKAPNLSKLSLKAFRACNKYIHKWPLRFLKKLDFWIIIEIFFISMVQYLPAPIINQWLGNLLGTGGNYFALIIFMPIVLYILFYFLEIDSLSQMDLITPAYPLALFIAKLGCYEAGCCSGIQHPIPIQIIEASVGLFLFIILLFLKNKCIKGTLLPIYITLYSFIRFFTEFLREEENILGILKTYHLICIFGVLIGLIEYLIVIKLNSRIESNLN